MSPSVPGVVFVPNPDFDEEVLRSAFVAELLREVAAQGATLYRDGVPVDESDLHDSVFFDVQLTEEGWRGRVGATDWKAALVEFGTSLRGPDGSLRRAIESIGLTLEGGHES